MSETPGLVLVPARRWREVDEVAKNKRPTGWEGQEKKVKYEKTSVRDERERKRLGRKQEKAGIQAQQAPGERHRQGVRKPEHQRFIFKSSRCLRVK